MQIKEPVSAYAAMLGHKTNVKILLLIITLWEELHMLDSSQWPKIVEILLWINFLTTLLTQ
jgi:hypothetical protein